MIEVIKITDENQHMQAELVGGRTVIGVLIQPSCKLLTVEGGAESDQGGNPLDGLRRSELDAVATELSLDPDDYRNMPLEKEAIIAAAEEQGVDLNTIIE